MNLTIKQATDRTELVSSLLVDALYLLTKPDDITGLPAVNATLVGRISAPAAYEDAVNFLNTLFSAELENGSDFQVSVPGNNYYIRFEDPEVEEVIKFYTDSLSITRADAATFEIGSKFSSNADITSFNELVYFKDANVDFTNCTSLERVDLSNLTSIGLGFKGCTNLEYFNGPNSESGVLTIANGTTSIGNYAFSNCKKLTEVIFPDSLTSIGYRCFEGSTAIQTIHFGTGINNIGEFVFNVASANVKNIYIKDLEKWLDCTFGGPISNAHHLYLDSNGTSTEITSIDFTGRTTIGKNSLRGDSYITSVTIPSSVVSVGDDAFMNCSGLTSVHISDLSAWLNILFSTYASNPLYYAHHLYLNGLEITNVTIPSNVTTIKDYVFLGCQGIVSVTIPNSVTSIGDLAFKGTYITSITVPDSVTSMGNRVFNDCTSLTSAQLSENVTEIKEKTFDSCTNLQSVTISNNTTKIEEAAFKKTNLKSLNSNVVGVANIPNTVTSIGRQAFYYCSNLTNVTIPNSVTSIGEQAFLSCSGLTSVTVPNSVTSIGGSAFHSCTQLTSITMLSSIPPTLSNSLVFDRTNNCPIYVPAESVESYKAASNWSTYTSRIQAIPTT